MFNAGEQVKHGEHGQGTVVADHGPTVVVQFRHGFEECETGRLEKISSPLETLTASVWDAPLEVLTRVQGEAIQSINDSWGIFARSRIALLPHQLWVCRQVLQSWPTRWLVADDVGLGKTIEAGLILMPLLSRGDVRRLLILCPASLVDQWKARLRDMFDIRLTRYTVEQDLPKEDFWDMYPQVVASLQTLRADHAGRHERMLEAAPWDLIIVDEAHHLNADEERGPTLGYRLVQTLVEREKVRSMVFFTGTPHRGKHFGFLSLLKLLRPGWFDPRLPLEEQLPRLRQVMIRNNKQSATDLLGNRLFHTPQNTPETYRYSEKESLFYEMLTEFIGTGKAYASTLGSNDGRAVMLVLFAMQKLASSSVAAILRAIRNRLARIERGQEEVEDLQKEYHELETLGDFDRLAGLDEKLAEANLRLRLMQDEEPRLRELIAAAEVITRETKIDKILELVEGPFGDRSVLFFTEYKATQSLLMSALISRYGDSCVTFINGDERADNVIDSHGRPRSLTIPRETAADRFNRGEARFLVSTEAGGEGIDLQESCHSLIHVDLPWNPMRLHQRVGRLNRYGQKEKVEVFTIRNPETVESHIWEKLNVKIANITTAMGQVMDEPEDLLQLVLGMTSPSLFRELFSEGVDVPKERLSAWFDAKTARFGGDDAIDTVRRLIGHCAKFDFQEVSQQIPRVDLPDLKPFFSAMLHLNRRQVSEADDGLSFLTPEGWFRSDPSIRKDYAQLVFDRNKRGKDAAQKVLGVGHKLMDLAMVQARGQTVTVAALPPSVLANPIYVCRVRDRVTAKGGFTRSIIAGVEDIGASGFAMMRDWELLQRFNHAIQHSQGRRRKPCAVSADRDKLLLTWTAAQRILEERLGELNHPFKIPYVELLAILAPGSVVAEETPEIDT
ncbi:MAG: SNF2-related protein [Planctomycetota bacterium]